MELPTHPEADEPPAAGQQEPSSRRSRVLVGVVLALVAVVVLLHLTGVMGPGRN